MQKRGKAIITGLGLAVSATIFAGIAGAQEIKGATGAANPDASQVTLGSNLFVDPCTGCNYNPNPSGDLVLGPRNCTVPGTTERLAAPFIAAATAVPQRVSASLVLYDPTDCPTNEVTLAIYTDACFPTGPGTLLASGKAFIPSGSCELTTAKLRNAPTLTQGTKYWVVATPTGRGQVALDALWHASNGAELAYNQGAGWIPFPVQTPGILVLGQGMGAEPDGTLVAKAYDPPRSFAAAFASNLFVDPCTGCNYDSNASGFSVQGPNNCSSSGHTNWLAVSFLSTKTGIPERISASLTLSNPKQCPNNTVTLAIYTDNCAGIPGTLLVSGNAAVPRTGCDLAVAKLQNAPSLTKGTKYWVVAMTNSMQAGLDALWTPSNNAQLGLNLGYGWLQFNTGTGGFLIQ